MNVAPRFPAEVLLEEDPLVLDVLVALAFAVAGFASEMPAAGVSEFKIVGMM
jgi:hypothetical protein